MRTARCLLAGGLTALLMLMVMAFPVMAADTTMVQVKGPDRVKAIAASGNVHAVLRADGTVWLWGDDDGDGLGGVTLHKVEVACTVRSMAVGTGWIALVCPNGTVWMAGFPTGLAGLLPAVQVPGLDSVKLVALARSALVAVKTDGTVWVSRFSSTDTRPPAAEQEPGLTGVVAVAASADDIVVIRSDSTAWARMAIKTKGTGAQRLAALPPVRSVSACGPDQDCDGSTNQWAFMTGDGHVVSLSLDNASAVVPLGFTPLECDACVAAGQSRVVAVSSGGNVQVAEPAADGRVIVTDIKKGRAAIKQVATGSVYDMGLAADGTVWIWAAPNHPTQVTGIPEIREIASAGQWTIALGADGTLVSWSSSNTNKTFVLPHVLEASHVAATPDFYAVLAADGSVAVGTWPTAGAPVKDPTVYPPAGASDRKWGDGHVTLMKFDGTEEEAAVRVDASGVTVGPSTPVAGLDRVIQVAAAENGYLALRDDGTVMGARWGSPPNLVKDVAGARAVAAGATSFAILLGDGSVRGIAIDEQGAHVWGDPHVDQADGIAAGGVTGSGAVVVLRTDGTVVTFSRRVGAGQVTEILDAIAVAAGAQDFTVLKADGTVWRWRAK